MNLNQIFIVILKLLSGIFLFPIIFLIGILDAFKQANHTIAIGNYAKSWNKTKGEVKYKTM